MGGNGKYKWYPRALSIVIDLMMLQRIAGTTRTPRVLHAALYGRRDFVRLNMIGTFCNPKSGSTLERSNYQIKRYFDQ